MHWTINPSPRAAGSVTVPGDKSITHRAVMLGALAIGESIIENYLPSEDCMRTVQAFESMGVRIDTTGRFLRIWGNGMNALTVPAGGIDAGNSGTTVRLLSGILASRPFSSRICGDKSLSLRPMKRIIEPLRLMGARITAIEDNYLPLDISGTGMLKPVAYVSPVASAQVKSCVLFAGLAAAGITSVEEPVKSRDHTERLLAACGADISVDGNRVAVRGPARLNPLTLTVPADISSAAFFMVLGLVAKTGWIELRDVGINPTRDGILEVLNNMGARIRLNSRRNLSGEPVAMIAVEPSILKATEISAAIMPRLIDEVPIVVLAATQAQGVTVISGASELRVKESDRIKTIAAELGAMGAHIEERPDGLVIHGPVKLHGATVRSHGDHRIAMTLAIAGCIAEGTTVINDVGCVDTSFPGFLETLQGLL
ncbi:MAG: 3-phosphoshikimate 1-carboxyvinyltransferase [Elusimicrobia bacterium]|nr:3-phosphoshikimate 1-carboxyvinyltransferase [Elusimicrobiota bacterium]